MKLFPPQQEILSSGILDGKEHCFICMPTGTGKTFLAEHCIRSQITAGYKAIYLTPLRALATQQYERFKNCFPSAKIGIFTGETIQKNTSLVNYSKSQIMIMTPERLDACMRNWRTHWNWIPEVNLIVVDEAHLLGQGLRGPRLEGTLTRFIRLNPYAKVVALSATMPNTKELSGWLQGKYYFSTWKQVPLEKKIVRFKSAKEKPEILLHEIKRCIDKGGQSLVFCNSRSRVEQITNYLQEKGYKTSSHHAGLLNEEREKHEIAFKNRTSQIMVATSTLEMGLNLPARQVIIYDSYSFSKNGFGPLPVWSFIQRAGRAGRPGMDTKGEVVMLMPRWVGGADKYLREECESIDSMLTSPKFLQEQILIDVHAGYSRSRNELENGFLPLTLFKKQHHEATINRAVNRLISSDLLIENTDPVDPFHKSTLKCTLLGRLSVKLMFAPETIKLFKDAFKGLEKLYIYDLLLLAAISEDCSPILQMNYEETDTLCEIVQPLQSTILNMNLEKLKKKIPDAPDTSRILAGIKMAAICMCLIQGMATEEITSAFDVYASDVRMLQDSIIRILTGFSAITSALEKAETEENILSEKKKEPAFLPNLCTMLATMLKYEIDSSLVSLTKLKGVGGKTAKKLSKAGYTTLQKISKTDPNDISNIPGIGKVLAKSIVEQAKDLSEDTTDFIYTEEMNTDVPGKHSVTAILEPYRLRRSMELSIKTHEGSKFCVTGGREDHIVLSINNQYTCDCLDYEKNQIDCKHIMCVKRALGESEICRLINRIKEDKNHSIRESLPSLWYAMTKTERES